jgi:EmrB/QacA subfamily drug resistance transporter
MCFGLFMVMLDNTVVNLALPTIQRELGADISALQWIIDAFTLLLAAFMLTGGTLGDLYGRRRAFMTGLAIFTAGSLLCALSPSVPVLIAGRVIQGIGAAVMMPSTLAILTHTFQDPKERAQAIGIWAGVSGIALAVGPAVGGVMVDAFGWESIFYLNVPIGLIAFALAVRLVPESKSPEGRALDIPGQIMAIVGLGGLTFAFIEANNYGWSSTLIVSLVVGAAIVLAVFAFWEIRTKSPVLQLGFFKNITFSGANLVGLLVSFGFLGVLMFLGLFMQNVQGFSPTGAGVRQLPSTLAVMVFAIISGRIVGRIGARVPITLGMLLLGGGILGFLSVQTTTPYSHYWWILAITGIGAGLVMSPITTAVMSTVPVGRSGMAAATTNTMRQVGGVFGIAVLGSVVTSSFSSALAASFKAMNLPSALAAKVAEMAQEGRTTTDIPSIPGLDVSAVVAAVKDDFTAALHHAVWVAGLVLLAGAVVAAVMIRGTSPSAQLARQAQAGSAAATRTSAAEVPDGIAGGGEESLAVAPTARSSATSSRGGV